MCLCHRISWGGRGRCHRLSHTNWSCAGIYALVLVLVRCYISITLNTHYFASSWMCCYNVNNRVFSTKLKLIPKSHIATLFDGTSTSAWIMYASHVSNTIYSLNHMRKHHGPVDSIHSSANFCKLLLEYRWYDSSISYAFFFVFVLCLGWLVRTSISLPFLCLTNHFDSRLSRFLLDFCAHFIFFLLLCARMRLHEY